MSQAGHDNGDDTVICSCEFEGSRGNVQREGRLWVERAKLELFPENSNRLTTIRFWLGLYVRLKYSGIPGQMLEPRTAGTRQ